MTKVKSVLFIAPTISDMYLDIISHLKKLGMVVDYIEDYGERLDPNYIRSSLHIFTDNLFGRVASSRKQYKEWVGILNSEQYSKSYDYLFVVDGQRLHPYLFDELRRRNPNLYAVNYLFDTTRSLYRFQNNFTLFDKVASFDLKDCNEYGLLFLPIYWCEASDFSIEGYDVFGFGGYGEQRYYLYNEIEKISKEIGLNCFAKLYYPVIDDYSAYKRRCWLKKKLGMKPLIQPEHYNTSIITHQTIPSARFRELVTSSKITVDSVNFDQDGMTARVMWALGAGRKVVTTNTNILKYDSYTPQQVYVIEDILDLRNDKKLVDFLMTEYVMTDSQKTKLLPWRLDNWLANLLDL